MNNFDENTIKKKIGNKKKCHETYRTYVVTYLIAIVLIGTIHAVCMKGTWNQ